MTVKRYLFIQYHRSRVRIPLIQCSNVPIVVFLALLQQELFFLSKVFLETGQILRKLFEALFITS